MAELGRRGSHRGRLAPAVPPLVVGPGRVRLSSRATPWLRLIVLVPLAAGVGFFVAETRTRDVPAWGLALAALGLVAFVCGVGLLTGRLWNVWLEDNLLIASRYTERKEIPLSEIKQVELRRVGDDSRIRITLQDFSSFGRRLTFLPVDSKRRRGRPAEIVSVLRARAGLEGAARGAAGPGR